MSPLLKRIILVGLVVGVVAGALFYREFRPQANLGAGYVAHQICSCVFVAERNYESCLPDLLPIMDTIRSEVVEVSGRHGVRGWIPALASRTALHTPGFGCALQ